LLLCLYFSFCKSVDIIGDNAQTKIRNCGMLGMDWQRRAHITNVAVHAAPTTLIRRGRLIRAATQTTGMVKRPAEWQGVRHASMANAPKIPDLPMSINLHCPHARKLPVVSTLTKPMSTKPFVCA